jgi:hypothetical protein
MEVRSMSAVTPSVPTASTARGVAPLPAPTSESDRADRSREPQIKAAADRAVALEPHWTEAIEAATD